MKQKTISILGATGSIGTQALDMVRRYPERFSAACLTANASSEKLFDLVRAFRPKTAGLVVEPEHIPEDVRFCQWFFGADCSVRALQAAKSDAALCAMQMMLQAADLGLGTTYVGMFRPVDLVKTFPEMEGLEMIAVLPLGYPAEGAHPAKLHGLRKPMEELVTYL